MSDHDKDLILDLPLDESFSDDKIFKFPDRSGRKHDGQIIGSVSLVTDEIFGACASFDGSQESHIEIADSPDLRITGDITVEAWVYLSDAPADWVRIFGKGSTNKRNYGLWVNQNSWMFQRNQDCRKTHTPLPNAWHHLSATLQGSNALLYLHDLQGKLVFKHDATWTGSPATSTDPLTIGYAGFYRAHKGRIAAVRVYSRALSQAEIERDMRADSLRLLAFRKSHPIDFRVYDDDEQAVLYISDDKDAHNLNLELRNTSAQVIQLSDGQNAAASESNYHFALRFRPGTLSASTLKKLADANERAKVLKQAEDWDLYFSSQPLAANEAAALYLRYKGAERSFQPNATKKLTLQQFSAAPGSGARGTQVELLPSPLKVVGDDATPITGSRTQYVHITNQRGRKNIPLHVSFVGGNTVLNNGHSSTPLTLRITNALREGAITLRRITDSEPSKFIISLDAQKVSKDGKTPVEPLKDWALVTTAAAKDIHVKVGSLTIRPEGIDGESPEWPIAFEAERTLAAGEHLQIDISGIVSSLPSGHANLYVRYENIPGYWDGQFVCTVEKGPMVIRDQVRDKGQGKKEYTGERWIGIGTSAPQNMLHIGSGTSAITADRVNAVIASEAADAGIAIAQKDKVNVLLQASGAGGYIGTHSNHGLTLRTSDADRVSIDKDGDVWMAGDLSIGIGTPKPGSYRLNVHGPLKATAIKTDIYTAAQPGGLGPFLRGNNWQPVPTLEQTIKLETTATVLVYYQIVTGFYIEPIQPAFLNTRLVHTEGDSGKWVECADARSTVGRTIYWAPSSLWIGELSQGSHRFRVEYRTDVQLPTNADQRRDALTDWESRVLRVLILGAQAGT